LNVKHRVRDIASREHILMFLKFQYGLSGSNDGNEDLSVKHGFACARHANLLNWILDNKLGEERVAFALRSTRQASAEHPARRYLDEFASRTSSPPSWSCYGNSTAI
jgi:hypothetical protein